MCPLQNRMLRTARRLRVVAPSRRVGAGDATADARRGQQARLTVRARAATSPGALRGRVIASPCALCQRPPRVETRLGMTEVTQWIVRARDGDREAADQLFKAVYADLLGLARAQVRRGEGGGLGSTSLVHEAYFRLAKPAALAIHDRAHFFAVAARAMRQIAVDHARERLTIKRGAGAAQTTLGAMEGVSGDALRHEQMVALCQAMDALDCADPRLARLVELRFFAGLTLEEAGEVLDLSPATLKRDFRRARAFLQSRLGDADGDAGEPLDAIEP
jgi:RNA polymerase sigma factor (TIGR02999 family)